MARRSKRLSTSTKDAPTYRKKRSGQSVPEPEPELDPKEKSKALLEECIGKLEEGIWWRILPLRLEKEYDIMSVGMGIKWEYLLPLLIDSGLLFTTKRETCHKYQISHDQCMGNFPIDKERQNAIWNIHAPSCGIG